MENVKGRKDRRKIKQWKRAEGKGRGISREEKGRERKIIKRRKEEEN